MATAELGGEKIKFKKGGLRDMLGVKNYKFTNMFLFTWFTRFTGLPVYHTSLLVYKTKTRYTDCTSMMEKVK